MNPTRLVRAEVFAAPVRGCEQHGFSFVSLLVTMLVLAVLYLGYFKLQGGTSQRTAGITAIDARRAVACRTNRQNIERDITFWSVNHSGEAPTLDALARDGLRIPSCPEGGRYSIVDQHVVCSRHP